MNNASGALNSAEEYIRRGNELKRDGKKERRMKKRVQVLMAVGVLLAAAVVMFQRNRSADTSEIPAPEKVKPSQVSGDAEEGGGAAAAAENVLESVEELSADQLQMVRIVERMEAGTADDADHALLNELFNRLYPEVAAQVPNTSMADAVKGWLYRMSPAAEAEAKAQVAENYRRKTAGAEYDIERALADIGYAEEHIKSAQEALKEAEPGTYKARWLKKDLEAPLDPWVDATDAAMAETLTGPAERLFGAAEKEAQAAENLLTRAQALRRAWVQSKDAYLTVESWTDTPAEVRRAESAYRAAEAAMREAEDAYSRAKDEYAAADDVAREQRLFYQREHYISLDEERYADRPESEELNRLGQKVRESAQRLLAYREARLAFYRSGQEESRESRASARKKDSELGDALRAAEKELVAAQTEAHWELLSRTLRPEDLEKLAPQYDELRRLRRGETE